MTEDKFIDLAFSMGEMKDLTAQDVKQYIRYICDRRRMQGYLCRRYPKNVC